MEIPGPRGRTEAGPGWALGGEAAPQHDLLTCGFLLRGLSSQGEMGCSQGTISEKGDPKTIDSPSDPTEGSPSPSAVLQGLVSRGQA